MRRLSLLAFATACACATRGAEPKMSFEELYATSASRSRAPDAAPAPLRVRPPAPETAPELHAVLAAFASRAQGLRQQVARGGTMPAAQVENWEQVTFALDGFLSRPSAPRVGSGDLLQAQSVLEAELERDGFTYGDMPAPLAEAVVLRVGRLALRTAELRRLEQPPEPAEDALPRFSWPVAPVSVTSLFGYRWHPVTGVHRRHLGVDLAATQGQPIYTADKGVVLRAGHNGDHGLQVEVQHEGRWVTRYSHLSRVLVDPGEVLERGNAVGLAGETGLATGVHLHFELWRDGQPMDPLEALGDAEPPPEPVPSVARGPVSR
ncbi:M23 family metallopeptidase [Myxococcus xanthus]|uniref:Peptidase M23 n=1 Tax=Myxococcus xanthus TaxID=34 RepID=A0AAE6FXL7_MYXXA|nr:M23 family metallopeptidase [Myxococcus xanthus]QDE66794.1 peptidase M23 [Myxococcus xanthus]QDE74067.1 peptidase M23 [Myxococcus xanthus]QDE81332.1 peptidase M23 [Myxococcus xanthus]QDE95662.1 peptidase M23 [Myxococcus xanthus]